MTEDREPERRRCIGPWQRDQVDRIDLIQFLHARSRECIQIRCSGY